MVRVIMGVKGTGKTKQMIDMINEAVQSEHGNVVCIEKGNKLTFDIHYQIRLVDSSEYDVANFTALKGFIYGLHAGNYDITHVFIDSLTKIVPSDGYNETEDFLKWLNDFGENHDIKFTITISDEPDLAPEGIKQGDTIETGEKADIKPGNNLPLKNIPTGTIVHAIELRPLGGAKIARSAGAAVQLVAKDGAYAQLRMPSGEIRNVDARCRATIGEVGNSEHANIQLGKAGRARWMGKRPWTRGESMNPVDHPHGGRTRGGKPPVSPWGKGEVRTRRPKKASNKMIVRRRPNGKNRK